MLPIGIVDKYLEVINLLQKITFEFDPIIVVSFERPLFDACLNLWAQCTQLFEVLAAEMSQCTVIKAVDVCRPHRPKDDCYLAKVVALM